MPNHNFTSSFARALAALACAATLQADANRTFVSTAGSDTNTSTNCGPTSPCRTFAGALSATNSGGEIVVLTSGGYGAFTINQAVTITAIGVDASITATSGDGVTINTTGNVTINGLEIHGGGVGNDGINVSNVGFLRLQNVTAESFLNYGVFFVPSSNGKLGIYDSHFSDNSFGVFIDTTGNAYIKNNLADRTNIGFEIDPGNAVIEDSAAVANLIAGFDNSGGSLSLIRDQAVQNAFGILANAGSTQFASCNIAQNTTYAIYMDGGTVTGSSPGTSVVSGAIFGSLGTAVTLQ